MATQIRLRRGTNAQHNSFTGVAGELTAVPGTSLRLHDGAKLGGNVIATDRVPRNHTYDTVALTRSAAGASNPILLEGEPTANAQLVQSAYGPAYKNAPGFAILHGTRAAPTTNPDPTMMIEKIISTNQGTGKVWDSGGFYVGVEKIAGNAYTAAITGYVFHSGGTEDMVGVHGRAQINTLGVGGRAWGIWGYTINNNTTKTPWHAAEFNGANDGGADPGWDGVGQCVRICMADITTDNNRMSTGLSIGKSTHGGNNGFYTGINIEADAVIPTANPTDNGEAIMLSGPASGGNIGGIRVRGRVKYALRTTEATLSSNVAALLGINHKITWGGNFNTPVHIYGTASDVCVGTHLNLDASGSRVKIQGIPVLNAQTSARANIAAGNTNPDVWNNTINDIYAILRHHGLIAT